MVESCRSPYASLGYSDSPCPPLFTSESSRHILIQELAARQDLLLEPSGMEKQGRSSYSCEPNVVIVVKDPVEILGKPVASSTAKAEEEEGLISGFVVNVEYPGNSADTKAKRNPNIEELAHTLLSAQQNTFPPQLNLGETCTPTPSYTDTITTPTAECPGEEKIAGCGVRGLEVAKLDDSPSKDFGMSTNVCVF